DALDAPGPANPGEAGDVGVWDVLVLSLNFAMQDLPHRRRGLITGGRLDPRNLELRFDPGRDLEEGHPTVLLVAGHAGIGGPHAVEFPRLDGGLVARDGRLNVPGENGLRGRRSLRSRR